MVDIGKRFQQISAALEDQQADHQYAIVEIKGAMYNRNLSILIDPRSTLSYINPKMMENC